jgi:hypothetical protein
MFQFASTATLTVYVCATLFNLYAINRLVKLNKKAVKNWDDSLKFLAEAREHLAAAEEQRKNSRTILDEAEKMQTEMKVEQ